MRTLGVNEATSQRASDLDWTVVDGLEAVRQAVVQRLRFWFGTWFLNAARGVPYRTILGSVADTGLAARTITDAIRAVGDVTEVLDVQFVLDQSSREASYSARVKTVYGEMSVMFSTQDDSGFDTGR